MEKFKPKVQQPPVPGGSKYKKPAVPSAPGVEVIFIYPWNDEDFEDCWWCGHAGADGATYHEPGEIKLCMDCADKLDAGAELFKQNSEAPE
jgi:hypothetical protein